MVETCGAHNRDCIYKKFGFLKKAFGKGLLYAGCDFKITIFTLSTLLVTAVMVYILHSNNFYTILLEGLQYPGLLSYLQFETAPLGTELVRVVAVYNTYCTINSC